MRYLSLAEALVIVKAITGTDLDVLSKSGRFDPLDSASQAPEASFDVMSHLGEWPWVSLNHDTTLVNLKYHPR